MDIYPIKGFPPTPPHVPPRPSCGRPQHEVGWGGVAGDSLMGLFPCWIWRLGIYIYMYIGIQLRLRLRLPAVPVLRTYLPTVLCIAFNRTILSKREHEIWLFLTSIIIYHLDTKIACVSGLPSPPGNMPGVADHELEVFVIIHQGRHTFASPS